MKTRPLMYLVACLFCSFSLKAADDFEPLATLVYLKMDCGSGGEVKFELNGDPDLYIYYWEHGPTELCLSGLDPGDYTFVVRDFYGCEERYDIEITSPPKCEVLLQVGPGPEKCFQDVYVIVINADTGEELDPNLFTIVWDDDPNAGFMRTVKQYWYDVTYNFTIYTNNGNDEICCQKDVEVFIGASDRSCTHHEDPEDPESPTDERCPLLIVNETNGNLSKGQYIELLAICEEDCGGYLDLRGFIIDDNNGELIKGNELIEQANSNSIGIDKGFLMFNHDENWEAIPNGSLILLYEETDGSEEYLPLDDPTDANQDGVYVLSASNTNYLIGRTGQWNPITSSFDYNGNLAPPSWELLSISSPSDGIQTRNPDGSLNHGISMGQSIYSTGESFSMHLHESDPTQTSCQFYLNNYQDKTHYNCFSIIEGGSPGLPNSAENAAWIDQYRNCSPCNPCEPLPLSNETTENTNKNQLLVYPNPFQFNFNISYHSVESGNASVELFNASSIILYQQKIETEKGVNKIKSTPLDYLPSGIYFLRFTFPNGEIMQKRIVHIQN